MKSTIDVIVENNERNLKILNESLASLDELDKKLAKFASLLRL